MSNPVVKFIPNLLTIINLWVGLVGVVLAFSGRIEYAGWCVLFAAVFDFADGFAARTLNAQSRVGAELDSLADVVTFGVLPGIILFQLLSVSQGVYFVDVLDRSLKTQLICLFGFVFSAGSAYRLAVFNVDTEQSTEFKGLPTPAAAIFVASIPIILGTQLDFNYLHPLDQVSISNQVNYRYWGNFDVNLALLLQSGVFLILTTLILTALMVSRIPILALKFKSFKWSENAWRYTLVIGVLVLLGVSFVQEVFYIKGLPFIEWVVIPVSIIWLLLLSIVKNVVGK